MSSIYGGLSRFGVYLLSFMAIGGVVFAIGLNFQRSDFANTNWLWLGIDILGVRLFWFTLFVSGLFIPSLLLYKKTVWQSIISIPGVIALILITCLVSISWPHGLLKVASIPQYPLAIQTIFTHDPLVILAENAHTNMRVTTAPNNGRAMLKFYARKLEEDGVCIAKYDSPYKCVSTTEILEKFTPTGGNYYHLYHSIGNADDTVYIGATNIEFVMEFRMN